MIGHIIKQTLFKTSIQSQFAKCLNFKRWGSDSAAYDGDGRTTVSIINKDIPHLNLVNTYSIKGFRLANNLFVAGSILLFPTHVYSWNVKEGKDITPESLLIFDLIVPKTKIVIIGYGNKDEPYDSKIPLYLKSRGVGCEMLPTPHAVTTYNFLVNDSVHVAGAFVPVKGELIQTTNDSIAYEHDKLFEDNDFNRHPEYQRVTSDYLGERKKYLNRDKGKETFDE